MRPIRVLLMDDHAVMRAGSRALLSAEPDFRVAGEAPTGEEGVERTSELRPDVVLVDLSMPGCGGGYLTRNSADHDLVEAIRVVSRDDPLEKLGTREREMLGLTAEGFSAAEIGERLGISAKTVETYRERLMHELELHHRSEPVRLALREELLAAPVA